MIFAVIKTGGKQYLIKPDQKIKIEKIDGEEGDKVAFKDILLIFENDKIKIGKPLLSDSIVETEILKQGKGKKKIVFKYKPKKRQRKKKGHRQPFTEILIKSISEKSVSAKKSEIKTKLKIKSKTEK